MEDPASKVNSCWEIWEIKRDGHGVEHLYVQVRLVLTQCFRNFCFLYPKERVIGDNFDIALRSVVTDRSCFVDIDH